MWGKSRCRHIVWSATQRQLGSFISHTISIFHLQLSARRRQISNVHVRVASRHKSLFPASLFAPLPFKSFCMSHEDWRYINNSYKLCSDSIDREWRSVPAYTWFVRRFRLYLNVFGFDEMKWVDKIKLDFWVPTNLFLLRCKKYAMKIFLAIPWFFYSFFLVYK